MSIPTTIDADCPVCGQTLTVPLVSTTQESATPGYALVTVEADPAFLADHAATHVPGVTLDKVDPALRPARIVR